MNTFSIQHISAREVLRTIAIARWVRQPGHAPGDHEALRIADAGLVRNTATDAKPNRELESKRLERARVPWIDK
jgi:hypothetical protein